MASTPDAQGRPVSEGSLASEVKVLLPIGISRSTQGSCSGSERSTTMHGITISVSVDSGLITPPLTPPLSAQSDASHDVAGSAIGLPTPPASPRKKSSSSPPTTPAHAATAKRRSPQGQNFPTIIEYVNQIEERQKLEARLAEFEEGRAEKLKAIIAQPNDADANLEAAIAQINKQEVHSLELDLPHIDDGYKLEAALARIHCMSTPLDVSLAAGRASRRRDQENKSARPQASKSHVRATYKPLRLRKWTAQVHCHDRFGISATTIADSPAVRAMGVEKERQLACLQCVRLGLPCSETYPTCSRCARRMDAFWDGVDDPVPCLAREKEGKGARLVRFVEDGDEVWARKIHWCLKMGELASEAAMRKNWALPVAPVAGVFPM